MPGLRPTLAKFGKHGRRVRVLRDAATDRVHVQWWEDCKRRIKVFANSPAGCARAKRFARQASRRRAIDAPVTGRPVRLRYRPTISEIWEAYESAMFAQDIEHQLPGYSALRPATVRNYRDEMRLWFHFIGRTTKADALTHDDVDRFRLRMAQNGYAVHSTRRAVNTMRRVMRWASGREIVERNRLETYQFRVGKDAQVLEPGEYKTDQIIGVLREMDPRKRQYWRAWPAFVLATETGQRARSILHLKWPNVDFAADTITGLVCSRNRANR